jgi:ubiquinone/menaquinone biosynthesis C-methylase UbiE
MSEDVTTSLRTAYDRAVEERDQHRPDPWKEAYRQELLELITAEDGRTLLEVGAGTGKDSLFFHDHGLNVTCIDLSPGMIERCRQRGLRALDGDIREQGFAQASFDAAYSMNCLLHIPKAELPAVLAEIQRVLRPGGLFFLGLWGGQDAEYVWADDHYEPKRFFSLHTDQGIRAAVQPFFDEVSFETYDAGPRGHFQRLILRRPGSLASA